MDTLEMEPLELLARTQHWYRDASTGAWYRTCIVRCADGVVCEAGILDTVLAAL